MLNSLMRWKKLVKYYPVYHYVNKVQFQSQCLATLDPKNRKSWVCTFRIFYVSTRCIAAGCSKTSKDRVRLHVFPADPKYGRLWAAKVRLTRANVVRSDVFFSAAQRTLRAVVLRIRSTPHIWHEDKSYYKTWRHPNNFSRVGSQRRYLKDVTNLEERMPNVNSSCKFELWGHDFSLRVTVQGNPSGPSAQQP